MRSLASLEVLGRAKRQSRANATLGIMGSVLSQAISIVIIAFLFWRVETLEELVSY